MSIILETSRFILRHFTIADAPLLLQLNSDPEVLKYLHEPPLTSIEQSQKILEEIILPQYHLYNLGRWAVQYKNTNEFVGWCGLKYQIELDEIDLGYRFMKEHWGKGIASETAITTVNYGFEKLALKTITGRAHIENIASQKVLLKTGLQFIKEEVVDNCPVFIYNKIVEK